jgi:hypothetical protein
MFLALNVDLNYLKLTVEISSISPKSREKELPEQSTNPKRE